MVTAVVAVNDDVVGDEDVEDDDVGGGDYDDDDDVGDDGVEEDDDDDDNSVGYWRQTGGCRSVPRSQLRRSHNPFQRACTLLHPSALPLSVLEIQRDTMKHNKLRQGHKRNKIVQS